MISNEIYIYHIIFICTVCVCIFICLHHDNDTNNNLPAVVFMAVFSTVFGGWYFVSRLVSEEIEKLPYTP